MKTPARLSNIPITMNLDMSGGKTFDDEGQVDTWLDFCTHEIEVPLMTWVYPCMGMMDFDAEITEEAKTDTQVGLKTLETALKAKGPFLLGDYPSLADIALVCALREGFVRVFDDAFRKPFPKVTEWFTMCCGLPQFKVVLGDVSLCKQAQKPQPVAQKGKEAAKPKEAKGKEQKSPKAAPAPAPKPAAAASPAEGDVVEKIRKIGDEIRAFKDQKKKEGLTMKQIDQSDEVKEKVAQLNVLKAQLPKDAGASPKASPAAKAAPAPAAPAAGDKAALEAKVQELGGEIRQIKERLKGEGMKSKQIDATDEVKAKVAELQALKQQVALLGDAPASPPAKAASPKASPKAKPAPAPEAPADDKAALEAKIKVLADEIREVKERMKKEGMKGKEIDKTDEVKTKVNELLELKKQLG